MKRPAVRQSRCRLFQPPSGGCVLKLLWSFDMADTNAQPPSGGCVLKHVVQAAFDFVQAQPPSGGCVLKPPPVYRRGRQCRQPPSGGCVLKLHGAKWCHRHKDPAAFGRLCVETWYLQNGLMHHTPAAFGRLCVETGASRRRRWRTTTSRLRAAVC